MVSKPIQVQQPADLSVRLSRHEFKCRYAASPQIKKAELIERVVDVVATLGSAHQANLHARLVSL